MGAELCIMRRCEPYAERESPSCRLMALAGEDPADAEIWDLTVRLTALAHCGMQRRGRACAAARQTQSHDQSWARLAGAACVAVVPSMGIT